MTAYTSNSKKLDQLQLQKAIIKAWELKKNFLNKIYATKSKRIQNSRFHEYVQQAQIVCSKMAITHSRKLQIMHRLMC